MRHELERIFLLLFSLLIGLAGAITVTSIYRVEPVRPYFLGLLGLLAALMLMGRLFRIREGLPRDDS